MYDYRVSNWVLVVILIPTLFFTYGIVYERADLGFYSEYSIISKISVIAILSYLLLLMATNKKRYIQCTNECLILPSLYAPFYKHSIRWERIKRIDVEAGKWGNRTVVLNMARLLPCPVRISLMNVSALSSGSNNDEAREELLQQLRKRAILAYRE